MNAQPAFWTRLAQTYAAGASSTFILHGNVGDHVMPGVSLMSFLKSTLGAKRTLAIYDRGAGFSFALPDHEQRARSIMLPQAQPAAPAIPNLLGPAAAQQPQQLPADPNGAFAAINRLLRHLPRAEDPDDQPTAVIITHAELIVPNAGLAMMPGPDRTLLAQLLDWGRADNQLPNPLILITGELPNLHEAIRAATSGYTAVEIPLPDQPTRLAFITWYLAENPVAEMEIATDELAANTASLTLVHVENILLQAKLAGRLERKAVVALKDEMVKAEYGSLVAILEPTSFDVVGEMDELKAWCYENVIDPIRTGRSDDCVQGFGLAGPPGTGKTYFISALAGEAHLRAFSLDVGAIQGSLVGESEKNLQKVLRMARAQAPCLIFIDELDQTDVAARGNGSGNPVAKNLFNQLLKFIGDPGLRGKVVFVVASNRPDIIDPALMRSGRIEEWMPVLLPGEEARRAIIRTQARLQRTAIDENAVTYGAAVTNKYSAADLASLVRRARKLSRKYGNSAITLADMSEASDTFRPNSIANADYYTLLAVQACTDETYLPAGLRVLRSDPKALQAKIDTQKPAEPRKQREL